MTTFLRDRTLERTAEALYLPTLPYHNFEHVRATLRSARRILQRAAEEGVPIDGEVVYHALVFHDAGYPRDHAALGYPTKEAYSAALASECLAAHGCELRLIKRVEAAILSTHRDASFHTPEQKAVRAADLAGLAANYSVFRTNAERLRVEWELLSGESVDWARWVPRVIRALELYLCQRIHLTRYFMDHHGRSVFHQRALLNLQRLASEAPGEETQAALDHLPVF
jgi:predicted metal-dependent HD superfamily phosphohydrolase